MQAGTLSLKELRETHSEVTAKYPSWCRAYISDNIPKREVADHPLRDWQRDLNTVLNAPADDRTVIFVVDTTGNQGKSWFADYYESLHDNVQIILPARKVDMAYELNELTRVLFVDAPRSKQGEFIQYDFLEDIKNGRVFSPKYESRTKHLQKCHVVCLMNEQPDMTKLSHDRYQIINL